MTQSLYWHASRSNGVLSFLCVIWLFFVEINFILQTVIIPDLFLFFCNSGHAFLWTFLTCFYFFVFQVILFSGLSWLVFIFLYFKSYFSPIFLDLFCYIYIISHFSLKVSLTCFSISIIQVILSLQQSPAIRNTIGINQTGN